MPVLWNANPVPKVPVAKSHALKVLAGTWVQRPV